MNYKYEYDTIDISKGIDISKTNSSKECYICHCKYDLDTHFKYEQYLCNGCHGLMQKAMNFNVTIVFVKESDFIIHFWYMSNDVIIIMKNSMRK